MRDWSAMPLLLALGRGETQLAQLILGALAEVGSKPSVIRRILGQQFQGFLGELNGQFAVASSNVGIGQAIIDVGRIWLGVHVQLEDFDGFVGFAPLQAFVAE